jgi:hypothetical protein
MEHPWGAAGAPLVWGYFELRLALRVGSNSSPNRTCEEDQISIGIYDDEGCGAPGFLLERLMEVYVDGLITQKELFDLVCAGDGDRSGEQVFAFPNIASEHGLVDVAQGKPCVVASDLRVKRWIAIDEIDGEAELVGVENTRCLNVGDK